MLTLIGLVSNMQPSRRDLDIAKYITVDVA